MDGLPGLAAQFRESFPNALVGRCWVHKATNVFARVPKRYQAAFKTSWDAVQYAADGAAARAAYKALQEQWSASCDEAVASMERDLEELLAHYEMPREYWDALRTTNPIEIVWTQTMKPRCDSHSSAVSSSCPARLVEFASAA